MVKINSNGKNRDDGKKFETKQYNIVVFRRLCEPRVSTANVK